MNEDLGKNILVDTILECEKYLNNSKMPFNFEVALEVKKLLGRNKNKLKKLECINHECNNNLNDLNIKFSECKFNTKE